MNKKLFNFLIFTIVLILSFNPIYANNKVIENVDEIPALEVKDGRFSIQSSIVDNKSSEDLWNHIFEKYAGAITGVFGIATLSLIGIFINNLIKLAASGANPSLKNSAQSGLLWSGIAAAGLGSLTLFVGIAYNIF